MAGSLDQVSQETMMAAPITDAMCWTDVVRVSMSAKMRK
jgi:hypothetical protein